jgi:hypothetical protein
VETRQRLGQSRHAHEQRVAAREDGNERLVDDDLLTDDDFAEFGLDPAASFAELLDGLQVLVVGRAGAAVVLIKWNSVRVARRARAGRRIRYQRAGFCHNNLGFRWDSGLGAGGPPARLCRHCKYRRRPSIVPEARHGSRYASVVVEVMAKKHTGNPAAEGRRAISFNGTTLTFFSTALVLAGALAGSGLFASLPWTNGGKSRGADALTTNSPTAPESAETPPWGDLLKTDIWVERPEEYVAIEAQTNQPPEWFFEKQSPDKARELMLSCGLSAAQVAHAMTPERVSATPSGTFVRPDDALVFSLPAETRGALYRQQPNNPSNRFIPVPFTFQGEYVDEWMAGSGLDAAVLAQFKSLVYRRGPAYCFSDLELMMRALPAAKQRLSFLKAVSRQPALLVRVRVRPSTDVDKVLGYWSRGTRAKDARPLLESLKRLPEGGSVSLLYLLPPSRATGSLLSRSRPPQTSPPWTVIGPA